MESELFIILWVFLQIFIILLKFLLLNHYAKLLIPFISDMAVLFIIPDFPNSNIHYCVRTHPNFVSQAREIGIFCEDCKLAAPLAFFRGFRPRFRVH